MNVQDPQWELLDETSREIGNALFRAHPEWRAAAWSETEEGEEEPFLVIQLPAASEAGFDLELSTYGGELTLSTRFWHEHSSTLCEDETDLGAALELIDDLLAGRVRIWSLFRFGEWHDSGLVRTEEELSRLERQLEVADWLWVRDHSGEHSRFLGPGRAPEDL